MARGVRMRNGKLTVAHRSLQDPSDQTEVALFKVMIAANARCEYARACAGLPGVESETVALKAWWRAQADWMRYRKARKQQDRLEARALRQRGF